MSRPSYVVVGTDRCPLRHCRGRLSFSLDRLGRTIATCEQCERRRRGICRDCPRPVYGTVGKALRCKEHKAAAKQAQTRAHDQRNREKRRAAERARWRRDDALRERKRERRREWMSERPEKRREYRRRYHLKRTSGYVAGYTRNNARPERAEAKRAHAMARYYELHPTRPAPVCRLCGAAIPFTGKGRPRVTCEARGRCSAVQAVA